MGQHVNLAVPLESHLNVHPLASLLWERKLAEVPPEEGWESVPGWEFSLYRKSSLFLSVYVDEKHGG